MATPTLPSASSIVDYLNSQKQDSSFSARSKLYKDAGLDKTLGEFVGSSSQNLNLLKSLQKTSVPATTTVEKMTALPSAAPSPIENPSNFNSTGVTGAQDTLGTLKMGGETTPATLNPIPKIGAAQSLASFGVPGFVSEAQTNQKPVTNSTPAPTGYAGNSIVDYLSSVGQDSSFTSRSKIAASLGITDYRGSAEQNTQILNSLRNQTPAQKVNMETKAETGISASDIYPDIFGDESDPNEADLVNQWLKSPEGQLFLDKQSKKQSDEFATAAAAKQALDAKYRTDKTTLENNLAEKGLAFSGIRGSAVKALADSLAASLLKEDRDTASKLLDSDLDLRDAVLKGVADLAKEADAGRKEAIQQLNSIGYAVINGQLVPTLASRSADRAEDAAARAERSLQLSERRLEIAEGKASGGSGNKLTMSEAQSRNLPLSLVGQTEEAVIDSLYSPTPPAWFSEKVNKEASQTLLPDVVQKLWNTASQEYLTGAKESGDHAKAAAYFKAAYGDAIDAETVKAMADAVEQEINGGASYKDAITSVIESNTE